MEISPQESAMGEEATRQSTHLVIAGPSSHNPELLREIEALAARLGQKLGGASSAAWFDQGKPTLEERLAAAAEAGATCIVVAPYLLQWRYPDQFSLPARVMAFARAHPNVSVQLARPIGLTASVEETLFSHVRAALEAPSVTEMGPQAMRDFAYQAPTNPRLKGPPKYPGFAHHVLICQGRPCLEAGSIEIEQALRATVQDDGLDKGPDRVHISRPRCLGPCGGAAIVAAYPESDWYFGIEPKQVPDLLATITQRSDALADKRFRPG